MAPSIMRANDSRARIVFTYLPFEDANVRPGFGNRAVSLWAEIPGFASPPRDGFAFVDLSIAETLVVSCCERWSLGPLAEMGHRYQYRRLFGSVSAKHHPGAGQAAAESGAAGSPVGALRPRAVAPTRTRPRDRHRIAER